MKQIATMETEISLLKTREVDQKNQASGYETLLRDGIPLNEHFLALKNKFNNEKDTLTKHQTALKDEIHIQEGKNQMMQDRIDTQKRDLTAAVKEYEKLKELSAQQMHK